LITTGEVVQSTSANDVCAIAKAAPVNPQNLFIIISHLHGRPF
jgi:hypothetical protein